MDGFILLRFLSGFLGMVIAVSYFYQLVYLFLPLVLKPKRQERAFFHRYAILIAARNEEE